MIPSRLIVHILQSFFNRSKSRFFYLSLLFPLILLLGCKARLFNQKTLSTNNSDECVLPTSLTNTEAKFRVDSPSTSTPSMMIGASTYFIYVTPDGWEAEVAKQAKIEGPCKSYIVTMEEQLEQVRKLVQPAASLLPLADVPDLKVSMIDTLYHWSAKAAQQRVTGIRDGFSGQVSLYVVTGRLKGNKHFIAYAPAETLLDPVPGLRWNILIRNSDSKSLDNRSNRPTNGNSTVSEWKVDTFNCGNYTCGAKNLPATSSECPFCGGPQFFGQPTAQNSTGEYTVNDAETLFLVEDAKERVGCGVCDAVQPGEAVNADGNLRCTNCEQESQAIKDLFSGRQKLKELIENGTVSKVALEKPTKDAQYDIAEAVVDGKTGEVTFQNRRSYDPQAVKDAAAQGLLEFSVGQHLKDPDLLEKQEKQNTKNTPNSAQGFKRMVVDAFAKPIVKLVTAAGVASMVGWAGFTDFVVEPVTLVQENWKVAVAVETGSWSSQESAFNPMFGSDVRNVSSFPKIVQKSRQVSDGTEQVKSCSSETRNGASRQVCSTSSKPKYKTEYYNVTETWYRFMKRSWFTFKSVDTEGNATTSKPYNPSTSAVAEAQQQAERSVGNSSDVRVDAPVTSFSQSFKIEGGKNAGTTQRLVATQQDIDMYNPGDQAVHRWRLFGGDRKEWKKR